LFPGKIGFREILKWGLELGFWGLVEKEKRLWGQICVVWIVKAIDELEETELSSTELVSSS
jgi:hypothetical protein